MIILFTNRKPRICLSFKETCLKNRKSEKEDGAVQTEPSINVETVHEEKEEPMSDDSEIEPIVKKKYNYNVSVNSERFGNDGEKQNLKSRNHSQQDIRIPDGIH